MQAASSASVEATTPRITTQVHAIARNAAASTLGASVVALAVTPLDVVKVRMQAHVCPVGGVLPCEDPQHVAGMRDAARKIVRADGVRGLWRGLSATLALALPTTSLYFTMYESFMGYASTRDGIGDGTAAVVSGAGARIFTATLASPVELARVRVQAGARDGVGDILRSVYKEEGLRALWRGLGPTLVRDAPFSAIYWGAYEALKDPNRSLLPTTLLSGQHNFAGFLASGIGAGTLAAVLTVPADVVKTRRQTTAGMGAGVGKRQGSPGDIVRLILRDEGMRGMFRGVGPRVVKVAPSCAIMMGSYELFKAMLP